jgi:hypothetical protein
MAECKYDKNGSKIGYVGLAGVAIVIIWIILTFTHCLKRRKNSEGSMEWRCRNSTRRCACLKGRPKSYEEHLERQIEKAKTSSYNTTAKHNDTTFTTLVN